MQFRDIDLALQTVPLMGSVRFRVHDQIDLVLTRGSVAELVHEVNDFTVRVVYQFTSHSHQTIKYGLGL